MMAPDPPQSMGEVKNNNQLATRLSKGGGGWQESINNHTITTGGDNKGQERVVDDEGSSK
jgi:hypothetical protein